MGGRDPLLANPAKRAAAVPSRFWIYERRTACTTGADASTNGEPARSRETIFTAGSGIIAAAFHRGDAARARTDDERSGAGQCEGSAKHPGAAAQRRGAHQCCTSEPCRAHGCAAPAARTCDASRRARTGANDRSTRQRRQIRSKRIRRHGRASAVRSCSGCHTGTRSDVIPRACERL
jgi:hypothetical protein